MLTNNKAMILLADKYGIPDEILDKIYQYINQNKIKCCTDEFINPHIEKVFNRMFNNTYERRFSNYRDRAIKTIHKGRYIIRMIYPKCFNDNYLQMIEQSHNVVCKYADPNYIFLNGQKHCYHNYPNSIHIIQHLTNDKRDYFIEQIKENLTDKYCKIKDDKIIPNFKKNMKKEVYYHMLIDIAGVTRLNGERRNIITPRESSRRYIEKHFS